MPRLEAELDEESTESSEEKGSYINLNAVNPEMAALHFGRIVQLMEESHGPDFPYLAAGLNEYGEALAGMENFLEARTCFERAIVIDERELGAGDPEVARGLNNLAHAMCHLGEPSGALPLIQRALEIDRKGTGAIEAKYARDQSTLGDIQFKLGRLDDAQFAYELALLIDMANLGDSDFNLAIRHHKLGLLLLSRNDLEPAVVHLEIACDLRGSFLGGDHRLTWKSLCILEKAHLRLGNFERAKAMRAEATQFLVEILREEGSENPRADALAEMRATLETTLPS